MLITDFKAMFYWINFFILGTMIGITFWIYGDNFTVELFSKIFS